jgi:hypothetical protein
MTTDKKIDLNAPVTKEEVAERLSKLTPEQLKEARQQQVDNAILNPKSKDDVDWSRLSDSDFVKTRMRLFGF